MSSFGIRGLITGDKKVAQTKWYQLDNAAKIVPSTTGGSDSRVFRITCELKEEVDPEALQSAVTSAAREFPHFSSILKEGMFWYYLDQSDLEAEVTPDNQPALDTIYREGRRNLQLFRAADQSGDVPCSDRRDRGL